MNHTHLNVILFVELKQFISQFLEMHDSSLNLKWALLCWTITSHWHVCVLLLYISWQRHWIFQESDVCNNVGSIIWQICFILLPILKLLQVTLLVAWSINNQWINVTNDVQMLFHMCLSLERTLSIMRQCGSLVHSALS